MLSAAFARTEVGDAVASACFFCSSAYFSRRLRTDREDLSSSDFGFDRVVELQTIRVTGVLHILCPRRIKEQLVIPVGRCTARCIDMSPRTYVGALHTVERLEFVVVVGRFKLDLRTAILLPDNTHNLVTLVLRAVLLSDRGHGMLFM